MRAALLLILLATATAHADVVAGVVIDDARVGIAGATVRIVGTGVVVVTRADGRGQFRAAGLPPGPYRIEVEHGTVRDPYPPPVRIDRFELRCCVCAMQRAFEMNLAARVPLRRGPVDTRSTTLGIRIPEPGRD